VDASKATARATLATGTSVLVYPGGEKEQILTERGKHILYLERRKGFLPCGNRRFAVTSPSSYFLDTRREPALSFHLVNF
jgi:hypothetical protein